MKRHYISISGIAVLLVCWTTISAYAIPINPYYNRETIPDNSQRASDYNNPPPAHGNHWGNMMCGPTSAKNSMVWLANTYCGYKKLKKKLVQTPDELIWIDVPHQDLIEELAKDMVPGWDWDNSNFPGVLDDAFVNGKKKYAEDRGLKLDIKWMKATTLGLGWGKETLGDPTLDWILKEYMDGEDIELSTTTHWVTLSSYVSVSGWMGDLFDDENGNGLWDDGEDFWDENYLGLPDNPGVYDYYIKINDPWPDGWQGASSSDGWQLVTINDGKLYLGSLGYIETAVSESIPEPTTVLLLGLGGLALLRRRRKA
jgi:hypothetical protein